MTTHDITHGIEREIIAKKLQSPKFCNFGVSEYDLPMFIRQCKELIESSESSTNALMANETIHVTVGYHQVLTITKFFGEKTDNDPTKDYYTVSSGPIVLFYDKDVFRIGIHDLSVACAEMEQLQSIDKTVTTMDNGKATIAHRHR
jgi:hypothetical protein